MPDPITPGRSTIDIAVQVHKHLHGRAVRPIPEQVADVKLLRSILEHWRQPKPDAELFDLAVRQMVIAVLREVDERNRESGTSLPAAGRITRTQFERVRDYIDVDAQSHLHDRGKWTLDASTFEAALVHGGITVEKG